MQKIIVLLMSMFFGLHASKYGTLVDEQSDRAHECALPIPVVHDTTASESLELLKKQLDYLKSPRAFVNCSLQVTLEALKTSIIGKSQREKQALLAYCTEHGLLEEYTQPCKRVLGAIMLTIVPAAITIGTAMAGHPTAALIFGGCSFVAMPSIPAAFYTLKIEDRVLNPARREIRRILQMGHHEI